MTTFKANSVLTTSSSDTQAGFTITFNASHPTNSNVFIVTDNAGAPIFAIGDPSVNPSALCYGDYLGAIHSSSDSGAMRAEGRRNPAGFFFPDGTAATGMHIWSGTGAPSATTIGGAGAVGDLYWRFDGGSGTYVYHCTVAGTPGTWAAIY